MSEQADLDELARRYLDLWQDQISALAADEESVETLQKLMTTMGAAIPAALAAWPAMMAGLTPMPTVEPDAHGATQDQARDPGTPPASASGTAAPTTASGDGGVRLDDIARRLAALEERIAAVEAKSAGARRRAPAKPRKGRS